MSFNPFYILLALLVIKATFEVFGKRSNRTRVSESDKGDPNQRDILRKFRRWEFRKRRKASDDLRKQQEWWRGIDGMGFELGVAKEFAQNKPIRLFTAWDLMRLPSVGNNPQGV